jgi:CheY-like chemotaxis protein
VNRAAGPPATRVLIVEDDDDLRSLLQLALRRAGLETAEASNGRAALQLIETEPIAVVVCDMGMPGMSGLEVVRALRERPGSSTLPFLLMTGSGDGETVLELRPAFAKLDISLVRGIDGDPLRQALAAGLAHFAVRGGCQLIAEGVERQAEADALADLGVELGQGYLFGRPEPMVG